MQRSLRRTSRLVARLGRLLTLVWFMFAPFSAVLASSQLQGPPADPTTAPGGAISTLFLPLVARQGLFAAEDLADGWYLMVDDGHIVYHNLQRVYHPFKKQSGNPIIRADKAWEGKVVQLYGAALPNFRLWYSSFNFGASVPSQVLYAVSEDGLRWTKPDLFNSGSNALFGGQGATMVSVMHTPLDPGRPYKLVAYQNGDFYAYWSQDGIQTTPYPENPVFTGGGDVVQFYWDQALARYSGTAKTSISVQGYTRRGVSFMHSLDLVNWETQPDILAPDIIDDQIYPGLYPNFYGLPVFRVGEQYLGMLWVLKAREPSGQTGKVSIQLVSSHDGVYWMREQGNRPAILDAGLPGAWDDGQVYTAIQPLRVGDSLWLYYSGCDQEHGSNRSTITCSIGLATAPLHRLASLSGSGVALTESLDPGGGTLHINYDGSWGGLQVQLVRDGAPILGYEAENCLPLEADSLDQRVEWAGQTELPSGPFQVEFSLQNAALFAFTFKP